jgi:hypothetical protein
MAIVTALALVPNPVMGSPLVRYVNPDAFHQTQRAKAGERVLELIPPGATVESDIGLISHLVSDDRFVTWIGTQGVDQAPEWIVLDHDPTINIGSPPDAVEFAEGRYGGEYRTVLRADPF